MNHKKAVLVVAPSWLGDLVMSQTFLKLIKGQNCSVDVLASKALHAVLQYMPEVNNCLTSPFTHGELKLQQRFAFAKTLRPKQYLHAYILPNSLKSALIPYWAQIPLRTGWLGEYRYILLNDLRTTATKIPLMVERFAKLALPSNSPLPQLPWPQLQVTTKTQTITLKRLNISIAQRPILALCPGAEYGIAKRWPPQYFAQVAQKKYREGWDIWLLGSLKEKAIAQEIQAYSENICLDLIGKTNLQEVIALLATTTAVVTNDSGLMHITAALNKPLVAIYGSSSSKFTPPLTSRAKILTLNLPCSPCFKRTCPLKHLRCLNDLQPELVLQALREQTQ